jgi:hypothetical protein
MVVFVPMSLKQLEEDGWCKDYFFPDDVKSILRTRLRVARKLSNIIEAKFGPFSHPHTI